MAPERIPFAFTDASSIVVHQIGDGRSAVIKIDPDKYLISGNAGAGTATIKPLIQVAADAQWRVKRITPIFQKAVIKPFEPLPSAALEGTLDRVVLGLQEAGDDIEVLTERALTLPEGETGGLPPADQRRGTVMGFDPVTGAVALTPKELLAPGAPGTSDNSYTAENGGLAAFKASSIARATASLVGIPGVADGRFNWTPGNFTGQADDQNTIKADGTPLSQGAWLRQNQDSIARRSVAQLLASTAAARGVGAKWYADQFTYAEVVSGESDYHVVTAGGVKLKIVGSITPEALGAPCDGIGDDAPYFERGWQIAQTVVLNSAGTYRLASIIGIRDQTIFADNAITLQGNGARVIVKSPLVNGVPEAIFTSASAKANPDSQDDLYTGKLFFTGCNWEEESPSVIFNGDRLYQIEITGNSFSNIDTIIKSFRAKGNGPYPQGYLQSVRIGDNQMSGVRRMIDAKQGFDIAVTDNKCSSCGGGAYIDSDTADAAVTRFTWSNNLWQGGGLAVVLGKVIGCTINAGYNESNTAGDAATAKCDFWFKAGPSPSSGVTITGIKFQPNPTQIADPDYVSIRIDYQPLYPVAPAPVLTGCWTAGTRLVTPGKAELINCGSNTTAVVRNALAPRAPTTARRTTVSGTQIFLASSELTGSKFRVGRANVQYVKSLLLDQQRPAAGSIRLFLQHGTAAGVVVGATVVDVGFVMMAASEGVSPSFAVNDVYMSFYLKGFSEVPAGQPIDNLGALTRTHFTNPALTFSRTGDFYDLYLDGYAAQVNPNYGFSDKIIAHLTIEADARNSSLVITSPIEVA
jgi:hypothetical protein